MTATQFSIFVAPTKIAGFYLQLTSLCPSLSSESTVVLSSAINGTQFQEISSQLLIQASTENKAIPLPMSIVNNKSNKQTLMISISIIQFSLVMDGPMTQTNFEEKKVSSR